MAGVTEVGSSPSGEVAGGETTVCDSPIEGVVLGGGHSLGGVAQTGGTVLGDTTFSRDTLQFDILFCRANDSFVFVLSKSEDFRLESDSTMFTGEFNTTFISPSLVTVSCICLDVLLAALLELALVVRLTGSLVSVSSARVAMALAARDLVTLVGLGEALGLG